jgi:hypothetical protein
VFVEEGIENLFEAFFVEGGRVAVAPQTQDAPEQGNGGDGIRERDWPGSSRTKGRVRPLRRVHSSGLYWQGWRAYRVDDPETVEPPAVAFFCQACAEREFGYGADSAL